MSERADPFPWLPDPVVKTDDKAHYKPFKEVIGTETTEHRPSAAAPTNKTVAEQFQVFYIRLHKSIISFLH